MKGFALVSWLALAGLTAALYLSPDEPLRAVESEEVAVTLRNFSLQRPELVQMSHVTPQAPAVKEEEPVAANENTANAEAPLPPQAQAAALEEAAPVESCRVWGPWSERDLPHLHTLLGPRGLENHMQMVRTSLASEFGVYTIVGQTRGAAEGRWKALEKEGVTGHVVTHFQDEGWGILFGRFGNEGEAQKTAESLASEHGVKRLSILQFGNRNETLVDLLFRELNEKDIRWLEKEAARHTGTTLRACPRE